MKTIFKLWLWRCLVVGLALLVSALVASETKIGLLAWAFIYVPMAMVLNWRFGLE